MAKRNKSVSPSTNPVIKTTIRAKARISFIVMVWWVVFFKVRSYCGLLIGGSRVDVAEPSPRRESNPVWMPNRVHDGAFGFKNGPPRINRRSSHVRDIWTAGKN